MKHYFKLSALFFIFTLSVTLWMSFELGLLSFGKLEAADEVKVADSGQKETADKSEPKNAKIEAGITHDNSGVKNAEVLKSNTLNTSDSLAEKERQLTEREEFLKKQSEYYEKVIFELKDKLNAQVKANKEALNKSEAESKSKLERKELEITHLKKELSSWKDARAELFRGLYEKMESKKAAKILETMDTELSNKILAGMKQDKAAEIMSKMAPDKAKTITEKTFSERDIGSLSNKVNNSPAVSEMK